MTVRELIEMLKTAKLDAEVTAGDIYGEGEFPITGMTYDANRVELTGERED